MAGPESTRDPRATIVDAAARILRDGGAGALTTRAVAAAAGVQAPTIYRLFGDKDGLVDAVAEHVMSQYVATKSARDEDPEAGRDPVGELRAGWERHVDFGLANPDLHGLLNAPGRSEDSPATVAGIRVLRDRVHRLAAAGLLRVDEDRAVSMIHAAGTGTVLALVGVPAKERDPGLSGAMLDAVLRTILVDPGRTPDTAVTGAVVTFGAMLPEVPGLSDAERAMMAEWLARASARLRDRDG
ncbi:MAG: TetR family transcriptional regulator [Actinobacteria bacterium]|nr:TetR family transcriptional regulator [Actinomycetota bacterium]